MLLAAYYGLRRSEVIGLRWEAVDFENKTITINHKIVNDYRRINLEDIARTVSISKSSVLNIFKSYLHTSPINYVLEYRLKRAAKLLSETENSVSVIAQTAGFENVGYFCRKFKALYGMTPKEYRDHRRSEGK